MKSTVTALALAAGSQALVARQDSCCFGISAYGGRGGQVGQLGDGQNRIGDKSLWPAEYCIDSDGGLTDQDGRGCIWTSSTNQFQCEVDAKPASGFNIACNGTMRFNDEDTFYACPTGQSGGYNIYQMPIKNEPNCEQIWMLADSCHSGCPVFPAVLPPRPSSPPSAPAACPAELTGDWQFPHLIVPVDSKQPAKAYGTQYNSTASGSVSSIFNFDIPSSYAGKECSLEFFFPTQDQLETSAFEYTAGKFNLAFLEGYANQHTNFVNAPKVLYDFGNFKLKPGTATHIGQCPHGCASGETISFSMSAVGDASLNYFQDSNPCPIGLYVTAQ